MAHSGDFAARRAAGITRIRRALSVLSGAALVPAILILPKLSAVLGLENALTAVEINKFLLGLVSTGKLGELVAGALNALMLRYPLPAVFVIGAIAGWIGLKKQAEALQDSVFAEFNDEVLTRIAKPLAFDPLRGAALVKASDTAMPWSCGNSSRRAAWDAARSFVLTSVERASAAGSWWKTEPKTPFGWTLILGRPGSGKSRLAVEFARAMARREHFGEKGTATWRDRFSAWGRLQLRAKSPRPEDPWDAGWLNPGAGAVQGAAYPAWEGRRDASDDNPWLKCLRAWRPRRPTLLLLDDPRLGDAKTIVTALEAAAKDFRHPVRMMIVNQSAPAELGLKNRKDVWSTEGGLLPLAPPILLTDECSFTAADIRGLRAGLPAAGGRFPLSRDPQVDEFLVVTRGNPLLVELGLKWLRAGRPAHAMTEDALLGDRIDRIVDALQQAGLREAAHHRAVAVATLAGGAVNGVERQGRTILTTAYPLPLQEAVDLARVYPIDRTDLREALPPIRPEMIGDAFVRRMMDDISRDEQLRMIATAWSVDPDGTLRSALRLGRTDDELGKLLREGPPENLSIDPALVALAYAQAAVQLPEGAGLESREAQEARRLQPTAEALCARLDAESAGRLVEPLLHLGRARKAGHPLFAGAWLRLLGVVFSRTDAEPEQALPWLEQAFAVVGDGFGWAVAPYVAETLEQGVAVLFRSPQWTDDALCRLAEAFRTSSGSIVARAIAPQSEAILTRIPLDAPERRARAYRAAAFLEVRDAARCAAYAEVVDCIASPFPDDLNFQFERAVAWRAAAGASESNAVQCREHAERVERIAAAFPDDCDMQTVSARAWRHVVHASMSDPAVCSTAAEAVDRIAAAFPDYRDMQYQCAFAWCCVAYASMSDAAQCRAHVETVDRIAARFPDDRDFQIERAQAWSYLAYASTSDVALCRAQAEMVDRIAAPFPDDREFQIQRAQAWSYVAEASRSEAAQCRAHSETVDRIAAPFLDDREFQIQRAHAWCCVAYASTSDVALCRAQAEMVDRIAAPFPDDCDFQLERAQAWRFVAYASTSDAAQCRAHAETVDRIAAPFPDDRDFQLERTKAWLSVAYASTSDAAQCRAHAETVERIVAAFPDDRDFQLERAQAWRQVAAASTPRLP